MAEAQDVRIRLDIDQSHYEKGLSRRGYFLSTGNRDTRSSFQEMTLKVTPNVETCTELTYRTFFEQKNIRDINDPIEFSLSYSINDNRLSENGRKFCKSCPILENVRDVIKRIPFVTGCQGRCKSMVSIDTTAHVNGNHVLKIVQGRDRKITLDIAIDKTGDTLHNPKILIKSEPKLDLNSYHQSCVEFIEIDSELSCSMKSISGQKSTISISFNVNSLDTIDSILFMVQFLSSNEFDSNSILVKNHTVSVTKEAEVDIEW